MSMDLFSVVKGFTLHGGASGGSDGWSLLLIPLVTLEHAASMAKIHLDRELHALPHMTKCDVHNAEYTNFIELVLVGLRKDQPVC